MSYEKIILDNGVRVLTEHVKDVRSASLGIWVGVGSRHEKPNESGVSHFIEHMLFKGTATRSAFDLAVFMDRIGGQVNAYTTKDLTCYHGRVIDSRLSDLTGVLGEMLLHPSFNAEDIKSERFVIADEIDMYEDAPEEVASEYLLRKIYPGSLGRSILGTKSSLARLSQNALRSYMDAKYRGGAIVVSLAGSFTESDVKYITEVFSEVQPGDVNGYEPAVYTPAVAVRHKETEQNHLCIALPGLPAADERRYALHLLSEILGGGMSSRLFQEAREKRGLCYSIYSYVSGYHETGGLFVSTASSAANERALLKLIIEEITRFRDSGATAEELDRVREQARSNVLMSLESTSSRMNRLGRGELIFGGVLAPEEVARRYGDVTLGDISSLAGELLDIKNISLAAVGRVKKRGAYLAVLDEYR